jgi:hypothetical protein
VERDRRDRGRVCLDRRSDDGGELFLAIRQARDDRSHHHSARHTRAVQPRDSLHAQARMWCARLGQTPHVVVQRADGEVHVQRGATCRFGEQFHIAQDQRRLGEDRERVRRLDEQADHALREVVLALGSLVGVRVRAHRDGVTGPAPRGELRPEPLHRVDLDDDPAVEVLADPEAEVLVGRAGEAVDARVAAPAVGVDRVVERHR